MASALNQTVVVNSEEDKDTTFPFTQLTEPTNDILYKDMMNRLKRERTKVTKGITSLQESCKLTNLRSAQPLLCLTSLNGPITTQTIHKQSGPRKTPLTLTRAEEHG